MEANLFPFALPRPAAAPVRRIRCADDIPDEPQDDRVRLVQARRTDLMAYLRANGRRSTTAIGIWLGCSNEAALYDLNQLHADGLVRRVEVRSGRSVSLQWESTEAEGYGSK